jgi:hypothetical protein
MLMNLALMQLFHFREVHGPQTKLPQVLGIIEECGMEVKIGFNIEESLEKSLRNVVEVDWSYNGIFSRKSGAADVRVEVDSDDKHLLLHREPTLKGFLGIYNRYTSKLEPNGQNAVIHLFRRIMY